MTDQGGDPACWLDQVCDECGALVDDRAGHHGAAHAAVAPGPTPDPDGDGDGDRGGR